MRLQFQIGSAKIIYLVKMLPKRLDVLLSLAREPLAKSRQLA